MRLYEIARTIRSKNAGAFMITVEIIFDSPEIYQKIKRGGLISSSTISKAYNIPENSIEGFVYYDPGLGIKANFRRDHPSGGPGETDVYGCQQYAPLLHIEIDY